MDHPNSVQRFLFHLQDLSFHTKILDTLPRVPECLQESPLLDRLSLEPPHHRSSSSNGPNRQFLESPVPSHKEFEEELAVVPNRFCIISTTRKKIRPGPVHLVHISNPRNSIFISLSPHSLRLWLNTTNSAKYNRQLHQAPVKIVSTSTVKSTCPGVSMILIRWSFQKHVVAADVIVMPRSCSCSIQSIVAFPSWTSPSL